ncbi:hypothetical protein RRG08_004707 [Elysia crispata]|uniref:Uncharacterized protein n=1 Tax=Elysia crispata TaxID=231223 RepID=A0AAE0ZBA7_9GAST|nr:hypothetical protein RRG08_004707 [Elysia crispata]
MRLTDGNCSIYIEVRVKRCNGRAANRQGHTVYNKPDPPRAGDNGKNSYFKDRQGHTKAPCHASKANTRFVNVNGLRKKRS